MSDSKTHSKLFDLAKARELAKWNATLSASDMDGVSAVNINTDYLAALDEIQRLEEQLEDERTRAADFGAEADALEATLAETKEQLEATEKYLRNVLKAHPHPYQVQAARRFLNRTSNPRRESDD